MVEFLMTKKMTYLGNLSHCKNELRGKLESKYQTVTCFDTKARRYGAVVSPTPSMSLWFSVLLPVKTFIVIDHRRLFL